MKPEKLWPPSHAWADAKARQPAMLVAPVRQRSWPHPAKQRMAGPTTLPRVIIKLRYIEKTGAGEGIRTLDPNLGKVVLYP